MEHNSKYFIMCSGAYQILVFILLLDSIMPWCAVCPSQCQLLWNWEFPSLFIFGFDVKLGEMLKRQSCIKLEQKSLTFSIRRKYFHIPKMEENSCSLESNSTGLYSISWFPAATRVPMLKHWILILHHMEEMHSGRYNALQL